jgi:hypothetical protein
MIGWKGATNAHMTYLPNKPTDHGLCLKTVADGHTRVMLGMESVEVADEQSKKAYTDTGKSVAMTLRLTEPWHTTSPKVVIADSWCGGLPTALMLL